MARSRGPKFPVPSGGKVNSAVAPMFSTTAVSTARSALSEAPRSTAMPSREPHPEHGAENLDRPDLDVCGDGDLEPAAAAEIEALRRGKPDDEVGLDGHAVGR